MGLRVKPAMTGLQKPAMTGLRKPAMTKKKYAKLVFNEAE
jgi:hypothetical protein